MKTAAVAATLLLLVAGALFAYNRLKPDSLPPSAAPVELEAAANITHWVTADRLNRRTCPSTDCGIVGQYFFREGVSVFAEETGWMRVSRYYDAGCINGRSEWVDSGDDRCVPENGVADGNFAEWVAADLLSETRPPDPAAGATGVEAMISGSDDFGKYRSTFVQAAEYLIASGCAEIRPWLKSVVSYRDQPVYFTYCGALSIPNRVYLNAETGEVFR